MANFLTTAYKNSMLGRTADYSARVDLDTDTIKAFFTDFADDTPVATDIFVSDILAAARVPAFASAPTLTGPVISGGAIDFADLTFTALTGDQVEGFDVWKFVTADTDSPLLLHMDTGVTGLPFTPSGGDVVVVFHASGLFSL